MGVRLKRWKGKERVEQRDTKRESEISKERMSGSRKSGITNIS